MKLARPKENIEGQNSPPICSRHNIRKANVQGGTDATLGTPVCTLIAMSSSPDSGLLGPLTKA